MNLRLSRLRELRWETYGWLIYSLPFLISSLVYPPQLWMKAVFLLEYAVFLVLYFAGYFIRGPQILWIVAGIDAIVQLRRRFGADLPAILITADRSPLVRDAARVEDILVLHKPVKPAALRALLAQWRVQRVAAAE